MWPSVLLLVMPRDSEKARPKAMQLAMPDVVSSGTWHIVGAGDTVDASVLPLPLPPFPFPPLDGAKTTFDWKD